MQPVKQIEKSSETQLIEKLSDTQHELLDSLTSPYFYIELGMAALAVVLAGLVAVLLRQYLKRRLREFSFQRIPQELLAKPLSLLSPVLSILYLSIAKPVSEQYTGSSQFTGALIQLAMAWLVIKLIFLVVQSRPVAWFISLVVGIVAVLSVMGLLNYISAYLASLSLEVGTLKLSMLGLIHGTVIFVVVFWAASALSHLLENYLRRISSLSYNARELIAKFFTVFFYGVAFLITLSSMGIDLTALAVFSGALGVGIGLGLQKITSNFVSGITLLIEKSIKIGDLIEVDNYLGWVRQLHMRYALIETFDGREVLVPNEQLISSRVTNWTYSNEQARIEVRITLPYDSDIKLARQLMLEAARSHPRCLKQPEPHCNLKEFAEGGIVIALNFWIPDVKEGRAAPQSDVMLSILDKFRTAGIDIIATPNHAAKALKA